MSGGTDRQKLRKSLKQGEKDNVDISHFLNSFVFGFYCAADSFF